jgi:hypothetical protein
MLVNFLVARIAIHRGIFITFVRVAVFADDVYVLVAEFVAGLIVIEPDFLPVILRMAVTTRRPYLPFMLIVFLVAGETIRRRVTILDLGFVTGLAFDLIAVGVGAPERKIRAFMGKGLACNRCNVLCSPLVFSVAILACALVLEPTVKAEFGIDVFPHLFVAIEAKLGLRRLVEPLVALRAVLFPLSVPRNHLSWHEGGFDTVGPGVIRTGRTQPHNKDWDVAVKCLHR